MNDCVVFERLVVGPLGVNCYLFGNPATKDAVCIDPGAEAGRILAAVEGHQLQLQAVLITHAHADHILAAHEVALATGVHVIAPQGEEELWEQAADFCATWGFSIQQPPPPDEWISPGCMLEFKSVRLEAIDVCGHSPAGLAFYAPGVVFTGDALFAGSVGRTDLPGQDGAVLIDRIRRNLLSLPANTVVAPGHGSVTTIEREAKSNPYLWEG